MRDLWIMYITATKTYYVRKEVKKANKNHEENEEINRILKEAGVSDSDADSSNSDSTTDSDDTTDYAGSSDETVIEGEDGSHSVSKRQKKTQHSHGKKRKLKKNEAKTEETMIDEIHQYISLPPQYVPLVKLSVIFIYLGCLWLRLPVTISDFHT